jgi:CRP-like cAMP-binding protein
MSLTAPAATSSWPIAERLDFLGQLSSDQIDRLVGKAARIAVPAGSLLYRPGQEEFMALIETGLLRAFITTPDGRQASIAFIHSREIVGTLMISGPAWLFLQTVTDTEMIRCDPSAFREMVDDDASFARSVMHYLANALRKAVSVTAVRSVGTMRERLALDLLERACRQQLENGRLDVRASHADLAASVGTSREVVTRTLDKLRTNGVVKTQRGVVQLADPDRLACLLSGFEI